MQKQDLKAQYIYIGINKEWRLYNPVLVQLESDIELHWGKNQGWNYMEVLCVQSYFGLAAWYR